MKRVTIFLICFLLFIAGPFAQVSINTDGSHPDPSAGLEIKFNNKGLLIPRMTFDQMNAIQNPAEGLMVFCTDCGLDGTLSLFSKESWKNLSSCYIYSPVEGTHFPLPNQITWNWNTVTGATGYKWNTTNDFSSAIDMELSISQVETGLQTETTYHRYIWAYSQCGISPATVLTATTAPSPVQCGLPMVDSRNNKTYPTLKMGSKCWIGENLNIGTMIYNTAEQSDNDFFEKYCYNNLESNCEIYGGLYQWGESMNYSTSSNTNPSDRQGICPAGWHLPSNAEWSEMIAFLGNESTAGGMMKEAGLTHWASPNTGGSNSSSFTGLPTGFRYSNQQFYLLTYYTYFWTSTENSSIDTWVRGLDYSTGGISNSCATKQYGLPVRCVQD
jgi:uncharacterized protein (TIGR02145 family)